MIYSTLMFCSVLKCSFNRLQMYFFAMFMPMLKIQLTLNLMCRSSNLCNQLLSLNLSQL